MYLATLQSLQNSLKEGKINEAVQQNHVTFATKASHTTRAEQSSIRRTNSIPSHPPSNPLPPCCHSG